MKDVLVLGGGIAGMYAALKCAEQGLNVTLFEKSSRLGGHIYSPTIGGKIIEAGAGRFNDNHKLLLSLLNRYHLTLYKNSTEKVFMPALYKKCKDTDVDVYTMIKNVLKFADTISVDLQKSITFNQLCEMVLGFEKTRLLIDSFGYNAEFLITNAYVAIETFKRDFTNKYPYYSCVEGLGELVKRMEFELENLGVKIHKDIYIHDYKIEDDIFVLKAKRRTFTGDHLILAVPQAALKEIPLFDEYAKVLLDTVTPISLHRIYAKYTKPWFRTIPRFTTDLPIRQFIPIYRDEGIVMVSYSDYNDADYWKVYADKGLNIMEKHIHKQLKQIMPDITIPHADEIQSYYWKDGTHTWIAGVDPDKIRENLQKIIPNMYIVGESYSKHQGWIEGALETVETVMPHIKKAYTGGEQINYKTWLNKKNKQLKQKDLNEFKKLYPEIKWVILQLPNESIKRFVEVTEWMYIHPGGSQPYIQHMYKDISSYFKNISFHYEENKIKKHVEKMVNKYTIAHVV